MAAGRDAAARLGVNRTSVSVFVHMIEMHTVLFNCFTHFNPFNVLVSSGNHVILQSFTYWCEAPPSLSAFWHHMSFEPSALLQESLMHFFFLTWLPCLQHFFPPLVPIIFCSAIIHRRGCRQQTSGKIYADWALKTLWWIIFSCT